MTYPTEISVVFTIPDTPSSSVLMNLRLSAPRFYFRVSKGYEPVVVAIGVTVSTFGFSTGKDTSVETFWAGVRSYLDRFPAHADTGIYTYFWFNLLRQLPRWLDGGIPSRDRRLFRNEDGFSLLPRADWESSAALNSTFDALRATVSAGLPLLANMKAELHDGNPPYSANPAFRETLMHAITSTS
ncbi:hypothetical protein PENARI_c006G06709 [Penicillium arizonense]|uniref:Uncharacterized protein n=1 Tax=Penicillium arizonense TaxID=1835702 RepID=A0A1F5LM81_PENAI|nr:hypothetical protein PENARI_c006G06709 [Penicillium arizonense]OGE54323.1 hypothetical protein PENARI_c006G06709 [Penicillium arizonense]